MTPQRLCYYQAGRSLLSQTGCLNLARSLTQLLVQYLLVFILLQSILHLDEGKSRVKVRYRKETASKITQSFLGVCYSYRVALLHDFFRLPFYPDTSPT